MSLEPVPHEGWFGKKIEQVFNKDIFVIEEDSNISRERIIAIINEQRYADALIYSCAVKDYRNIAKSLGHLGRIEESIEALQSVHISQQDALEFAKIFAKSDKNKAFNFYTDYILIRKRIKDDREVDWLIKICTKENKRNEALEELFKALLQLPVQRLQEIVTTLFENDLEESAFKVMASEFFREERKLGADIFDWVLELVVSRDKKQVGGFVDKITGVMNYSKKLAENTSILARRLASASLYAEAFRLGSKFLNLYVAHFKRENPNKSNIVLNNFIKADHKNFIFDMVEYLSKDLENKPYLSCNEKEKQVHDFLKDVFCLINVDFMFEVLKCLSCVIAKLSLGKEVLIEYGKQLFVLQFSFSRKDSLIENILKWLLKTTLENQNIVPDEISNPKIGLPLIKDESGVSEEPISNKIKGSDLEEDFNFLSKTERVKLFSTKSMIDFTRQTLKKYAGAFSQRPLIAIADFMFEKKIGTLEDVFDVALSAFEIDFKNDSEIEKTACKYYEIASQNSPQKAREIALKIMKSNPNLFNYNRLASLYAENGQEWLQLRDDIMARISCSDPLRYTENTVQKSSEILNILIQEEASAETLCSFLKQECCNYDQPEKALDLLQFLLTALTQAKTGQKLIEHEDFWFCAVHFNIIVATLKRISSEAKKNFIRFVERACPAFVVKTAITFSQALTLLIEKNVKHVKQKNSKTFFELLEESQYMFEKALKKKEWEILIENIGSVIKAEWLKKSFEKWRVENCFSTPMILIE